MTKVNITSIDWTVDLTYFRLLTTSRQCVLTPDEQHYLKQTYRTLYPDLDDE